MLYCSQGIPILQYDIVFNACLLSCSFQKDGPQKLFEWVDGPLVTAMKEGAMFLVDEISLADDSVLERLNSVLEPEQMILLAEKGGGDGSSNEVEQVNASQGFQVFATMNPGGDFGKKEVWTSRKERWDFEKLKLFSNKWSMWSNG